MAEETFRGVCGGCNPGLEGGPGVVLRTGLSGRGSDGRVLGANPIPFRLEPKPKGDSARRGVGYEGGDNAEPVGEGRLTLSRVGVGGGFEEEAEFRFVVRASGTKIPELG